MQRRPMTLYLSLTLCALALIAGCGGPKPKKLGLDEPLFYPPSPDAPRLQFLLSFSDAESVVGNPRSSFSEFIAGTKSSEDILGEIRGPYGVAVRDGKVYVCDVGGHKVHIVDFANKTYGVLGTRQEIRNPINITIAPDGTKYVCDTQVRRIAVFNAKDRFVRYLGDPNVTVPSDVAVRGDELFVVDIAGAEVEVWSREGRFIRQIARKGPGPGELHMPTNIDIDGEGRVYVTDTTSSIVHVYDLQGAYLGSLGAPGNRPGYFARPKGVATDPDGRIYVADSQWEVIQLFAPERHLLMYFGGVTPGLEGMGMPAGIAIDTTSIELFREYIADDFEAEYLLFVANQFGQNKVGVYAFGKMRGADYTSPDVIPSATPRKPDDPDREPAETGRPGTPSGDSQEGQGEVF